MDTIKLKKTAFVISDNKKKEMFLSMIQLFKQTTSHMNVNLTTSHFHIQGMDKSHVCLFDLNLQSSWFDHYVVETTRNLCIDANIFLAIIGIKNADQSLICYMDNDDADHLTIELKQLLDYKKSEYNKHFKMPLIDYDYEEMSIPDAEYDAEITISSKKVTDMIAQLSHFGSDLNVHCQSESVEFYAMENGVEMRVDVTVDDMTSYAVVEDEDIQLAYSMFYIHKMCLTNKLSQDVELSLSNQYPMKIRYDLGDESHLFFYVAPKVMDN